MSVGLSFKVDRDGDLSLSTDSDGNVTVDLIEGVFETQQALQLRLKQIRGGDVLHPSHGLPITQLIGPISPEYVLSVLLRELSKDGRVLDASGGLGGFSRASRILNIDISVVLKDGSVVNISEDLGF